MRPPQLFDSRQAGALQRSARHAKPPGFPHRARWPNWSSGRYLLLGLLVSAFTAVCTFEIIGQVWFPKVESSQSDCYLGIRHLVQALDRARTVGRERAKWQRGRAGRRRVSACPRARVARAGQPLDRLQGQCSGLRALKQIDQLRYAEEHAVRYEARNLSRHRREVETDAAGARTCSPLTPISLPPSTPSS
jgi:hypothetical protein